MENQGVTKLGKAAYSLFNQNDSLYEPLQILSYKTSSRETNRKAYSPDAYLTLAWKGKKFKFNVEVTGNLYLEAKLAQLKQIVPNYKDILIIVPYLTKGISELIKREQINCVDLSGNYYLQREDLLAIRLEKPDQYKSLSRIKKIYSGNSAILSRFLLAGSKEFPPGLLGLQRELGSRNGELAQSTISKVLTEMERDQIILKAKDGLKLLQARKLLDRLREQYKPPTVTRVIKLKCPGDPVSWLNQQIDLPWVRTGESSACRYSPTATNQVLSVYVPRLPVELPAEDRFSNLILYVTTDSFVYFDCDTENGWASQIQTYLELSQMDKREREIAETIKTSILSKYEESTT